MDINKLFPQKTFFQSDTWTLNLYLADYSASDYVITYYFKKPNQTGFSISTTIDPTNGSFLFSVPSSVTATYQPGTYYLTAKATDALGNVVTLGQTEVTIKADLSLGNVDPRSPNRIALDAIETNLALSAATDGGLIEYTINGTVVKTDKAGLMRLRDFYLARVRKEDGKSAIGNIFYNL